MERVIFLGEGGDGLMMHALALGLVLLAGGKDVAAGLVSALEPLAGIGGRGGLA